MFRPRLPMRRTSERGHRRQAGRIPEVALPAEAAGIVERARHLTAGEIDQLDLAEAEGAATREVIWHVLRDQIDGAGLKAERMTARNAAWAAVELAGAEAGIPVPPDDRSWRRIGGRGTGAARAARYAACLLVSRQHVDPEVCDLMIAPWARVVGEPDGS